MNVRLFDPGPADEGSLTDRQKTGDVCADTPKCQDAPQGASVA